MRARGARRILLLLGGLALVGMGLALIAETVLRTYPQLMPETARLRLHWRELAADGMGMLPHPYVGFTYPPNLHGEVRRDDFGFTFRTDERGFRNAEPWPARADIVVLGDSHTFAYGVDDDQAWTRLVADALPRQRLVNLGLIAASTRQYVRIYETFGRELEPALVVLMLFPGFALEATSEFESWLDAGQPGDFEEWRFKDADLEPGLKLAKRAVESSYLLLYLHQSVQDLTSPHPGRSISFPRGQRMELVPAVYASNAARATPDHPEFTLVLAALDELRRQAAQDGASFLILLMPTKEEIYLPQLGAAAPSATATFISALTERGVPFLDLAPAFRGRAAAGEPLFFEVDIHPNAAGNRLIAEVVLEHLRRNAERYGLAELDVGS